MLSEKLNEIFNRAIPVVTPLPSPDDPLYHAWKESVSQQPETLAEKLAYLKATPALLRQFCILGGAFFLTGIVACVWFYLAQKRFDRANARLTAHAVGRIQSIITRAVGKRTVREATIKYEYNLQCYSEQYYLPFFEKYEEGQKVGIILDPHMPEASRLDGPITEKPADKISVGAVFVVVGVVMLILALS